MKVLVAIDDSSSSQATLDALVKMHWHEGTELNLVTVIPPSPDGVDADIQSAPVYEDMANLAVELRNTVRQCEVKFFARTGDPKTVILNLAERSEADLIVVGSNCKSTMERLLLGSVCESILNAAQCPVIVAKTPCCLAREASPCFKNILVPIDNSVFSDVAVHWLANFDWAPDTRFIVAAAVADDTDMQDVRRSLEKRAGDLSKLINTRNIIIEVITGEPQHAIIHLAKDYYADMILMGSHGHTGLKDLILGSVSHAVSHAAPCAVAIVRGLADSDTSWQKTGAFKKLQAVAPPTAPVRAYRSDEDKRNLSVNVMPGGF
jgi:nucleotide-binding universal stress UspA family protein